MEIEQTSANPVLSVDKNGCVFYSNEVDNPLLHEWGVKVGEKLPSSIVDLVQRVISRNSPEKIEVKVGNKLYLVVFSPLHGQECVNCSGFDISDHRELGDETQQSEERLKALMDHNPSLVFMKDECGRYVYLNKSYEKQFVHSNGWYGKSDFDFWSKKSAELFRENDSFVLKSEYVHQFMEDSTDLNGTRHCLLNYKFPFTDSKNNKYVGGIGIDVTDRVRAEEVMQESEEKFRTLFNSIDEGICLVEVIIDDTGKPVDLLMLDYNSVFQQKTGLRFDIKGKNVRSVFTVYEEQWFDTIGEVALTGKSVRFENYVQSLNRWYSSFATRIGGEGSFQVAIVFNDITERKKLEEQIRQRAEELEMVMDVAPVAIWIGHDPQSNSIIGNRMANKFY
jgi:PAS domain S-box-containing protein